MATLNPIEWQCSECGTIYIEDVDSCEYGCKAVFAENAERPSHNTGKPPSDAVRIGDVDGDGEFCYPPPGFVRLT